MDEEMRCHICSRMGNKGIVLLGRYICRECELDLAKVLADDFKYEKFRIEIKDIWKGFSGRYSNKNISRVGVH